MNLEKHIVKNYNDTSWIDQYVNTMGDDEFYKYKNQVYTLLRKLKTGQSIHIVKWVKPENYDLFVKIACYYLQFEDPGKCYYFYKNYTVIKKTF